MAAWRADTGVRGRCVVVGSWDGGTPSLPCNAHAPHRSAMLEVRLLPLEGQGGWP